MARRPRLRRTHRRIGRRRRFKRRPKRGRRRQRMTWIRQPMIAQPDTLYVKLKWPQFLQFVTGTIQGQIYRGNSVFDPDEGGGSSQPPGFDEYSLLYSRYQVLASAVTIRFVNNGAMNLEMYLIPTFTTTIPNFNAIGNTYAKYRNCGAIQGRAMQTLKHFMRSKKMFGRHQADLDYTGSVTGNPANVWFWHFRVRTSDQTAILNVTVTVTITYYVKFWHRKVLVDL